MGEVLLVEPPATNRFGNLRTLGSIGTLKSDIRWPPLDLMIIAGLLKKNGIETAIFDANSLGLGLADIERVIREKKLRLVVFTTSTPTLYRDLQVAEAVKSVSPEILTAVTGSHINALAKETLELNKNLDFAVPTDSELSILKLVQANYRPEKIPGLSYRNQREIICDQRKANLLNLDELGIPSHDQIPLEIYRDPFTKKKTMSVTYSSRGCINQPSCIMCSACFYEPVRYRSVKIMIEEMYWLKNIGVREIRFPFESGFNNLKIANELFDKMIEEKIGLRFTCNGRADHLPIELLRKMKAAGCVAVNIGCESADQQIMKFVHKNITLEQVRETAENIKKVGMEVLVYFIFGLPLETKETMAKTLRFAKSLKADLVTFGVAIPHPGTFFYQYLKEKGYLLTEEWDKYDPMFQPPYAYPQLSAKEIYDFARKAYRSYYLRASFIGKRFLKFNLKEEFKNFIGFWNRYVSANR